MLLKNQYGYAGTLKLCNKQRKMKISIITTTYNSAATIRDTLESVKNQTYKNIEHIIVDGASKDNTLDIVREFSHVAQIISEWDKGIYDAMNKGIALATGDVIGILNSDDVFYDQQVLRDVMQVFISTDINAVYGNIIYFRGNDQQKVVRKWKTKPYNSNFFQYGEVPPHPGLFVKKEVYNQIGNYFVDFKICSDYEFMLRMFKIHGYKSVYLNKYIVRMRVGGISTSGWRSYWITTKELKRAWEMNGLAFPRLLYFIRPVKKLGQLIFR